MNNKIKYQKDYTKFGEYYQLVLPLNFEKVIPEDDSVRLLSHELEELDYTLLYQAYSAKGRNPAVDPRIMFKILVYAYSQNIYSSRGIELSCKRDINFKWLLAGYKAPDHSTIARFRVGFLGYACENLFYQMVSRLFNAGELSKETVFIDGTKLEACANKYTYVWKRAVSKWEENMFQKIQDEVQKINHEYIKSFSVKPETITKDLKKICKFLENICEIQNTKFVSGRGRRKSKNQRYLETFQKFLKRQTVYDWHTASFKGRNSYSKTDSDATFMHMKEDHLQNAQLKPGYNVQIGVDSEYIVATDIYQDRNDVWTLVPFLKNIEEKLGFRYPSVTADSGYESEEGYSFLRENKQKAYINPKTYRQWKKRSFKNDISKRENMLYDKEKDVYTCFAGKKLTAKYIKKQKSKSGYESQITVYESEGCSKCPYREKCAKTRENKQLYVSKGLIEKRDESYQNILSETGIKYRMNRSIQVEGAFGVLKNDYNFKRFLLRGKTKVKIEILLLCLGYNINKLHSKIQGERTQSYLFQLKQA